MRVAVKVDADCQLVYEADRAVLQRQYVLMTIIGIKDMVKCEDVTRGQSDTAWGKLSHIRNRSTPQEIRQAEFIKQQGGAFITVRF